MKILLCIDDTDDLVKGKGTGKLANEIAKEIAKMNWGKCERITRHQLLLHDDIPYTSHNSSMCFTAQIKKENYQDIINYASDYLVNESSPEADPGLCVVDIYSLNNPSILIDFGKRAKKEILTKEQAYELADSLNIHLSEHGGTGQGIIGAMAGVGLRLSGNDGEFRGDLSFVKDRDIWMVGELCQYSTIDEVRDYNGRILQAEEQVIPGEKTKTILLKGKSVLLVYQIETEYKKIVYQTCSKQQIRSFDDQLKTGEQQAKNCTFFIADVEEEIITDDEISCYNCRFRRWTANSFACCKQEYK